eukprot:1264281-Pyramimonas_sp.AAC.1
MRDAARGPRGHAGIPSRFGVAISPNLLRFRGSRKGPEDTPRRAAWARWRIRLSVLARCACAGVPC